MYDLYVTYSPPMPCPSPSYKLLYDILGTSISSISSRLARPHYHTVLTYDHTIPYHTIPVPNEVTAIDRVSSCLMWSCMSCLLQNTNSQRRVKDAPVQRRRSVCVPQLSVRLAAVVAQLHQKHHKHQQHQKHQNHHKHQKHQKHLKHQKHETSAVCPFYSQTQVQHTIGLG